MKTKQLIIFSFLLTSAIVQAQNLKPDCDEQIIGNSGLTYKISDMVKAVNESNVKYGHEVSFKVTKVDKEEAKKVEEDASALVPLALLRKQKGTMREDTYGHAVAGYLCSYSASQYLKVVAEDKEDTFLKSLSFGAICALAKEAYDSTGRGNVEFRDFKNTVIGAALLRFKFEYKF